MSQSENYIVTIDDDAVQHKLIEKLSPYKSLGFTDAESFLVSSASLNPLAILLDIHLTKNVSGTELLPQIRENFPSVPIIMISSNPEEEYLQKTLEMGANDYIEKPLRRKIFVPRLEARIREFQKHTTEGYKQLGDVELDSVYRRVRKDGKVIEPSEAVFKLLVFVLNNIDQDLMRDTIKNVIWGMKVSDAAIEKRIYETRQVLKSLGSEIKIKSLYGKGYRPILNDLQKSA